MDMECTSVNKIVPLCLKMLFYFKSHKVFLAHAVCETQFVILKNR